MDVSTIYGTDDISNIPLFLLYVNTHTILV
jgi:hypothetical protein